MSKRKVKIFGEMVRKNRLARNVTQKDIAKHVGITQSTLSKIEHGRMPPTFFAGLTLMDALKISSAVLK